MLKFARQNFSARFMMMKGFSTGYGAVAGLKSLPNRTPNQFALSIYDQQRQQDALDNEMDERGSIVNFAQTQLVHANRTLTSYTQNTSYQMSGVSKELDRVFSNLYQRLTEQELRVILLPQAPFIEHDAQPLIASISNPENPSDLAMSGYTVSRLNGGNAYIPFQQFFFNALSMVVFIRNRQHISNATTPDALVPVNSDSVLEVSNDVNESVDVADADALFANDDQQIDDVSLFRAEIETQNINHHLKTNTGISFSDDEDEPFENQPNALPMDEDEPFGYIFIDSQNLDEETPVGAKSTLEHVPVHARASSGSAQTNRYRFRNIQSDRVVVLNDDGSESSDSIELELAADGNRQVFYPPIDDSDFDEADEADNDNTLATNSAGSPPATQNRILRRTPAFYNERAADEQYVITTDEKDRETDSEYHTASFGQIYNSRQNTTQSQYNTYHSDEKLAVETLSQPKKILEQTTNSTTNYVLMGLGVAIAIAGACVLALTSLLAVGAVLANAGLVVAGIGIFNQYCRSSESGYEDIATQYSYNY